MLTAEQSYYIEKQQTCRLKSIFGNHYSQARLLEMSNLPLLHDRRQEACLRFAQKLLETRDSLNIFKPKRTRPGAREQAIYAEQIARTHPSSITEGS